MQRLLSCTRLSSYGPPLVVPMTGADFFARVETPHVQKLHRSSCATVATSKRFQLNKATSSLLGGREGWCSCLANQPRTPAQKQAQTREREQNALPLAGQVLPETHANANLLKRMNYTDGGHGRRVKRVCGEASSATYKRVTCQEE